jgi:hypothetical protein
VTRLNDAYRTFAPLAAEAESAELDRDDHSLVEADLDMHTLSPVAQLPLSWMHPDAVLDSIQKERDMTAPTKTERPDIDDLPEIEDYPEIEGVKWLTQEEARAYFDSQARRLVGMSGEEFLRRLDAGEFNDLIDDPGPIGNLAMISSFGR